MREFGSLPVRGTREDFAVAVTLPAKKSVNWHAMKSGARAKNSSGRF